MSGAPWPEPVATASDEAAAAILRQLWAEAERVEATVDDPNRLCELLGDDGGAGSCLARVVCARPLIAARPTGWRCRVVSRLPAPDVLLFYRAGSGFPDSALVFTGGVGNGGWVTFYKRPFVLHRLRERFNRLIDDAPPRPALGAPSIREQAAEPAMLAAGSKHADETEDDDLVPPEELYRRVLAAHFAGLDRVGDERDRRGSAPALAAHQARAYERACQILDRYGGVIVADAVGLGKTYIGLRLLERALDEHGDAGGGGGGRALVIVPAALRDQWERDLAYLGMGRDPSAARSDPKPAEASGVLDLWIREAGRVTLLSMETLGRRRFDTEAYRGADLVLVDEAHNFRNPATRRYRVLSELTRHSKIALLTATPINNTLFDLQHLIDLFAAPGAFRHLGVPDYREAFRRAAAGDGDIQRVVSACVLRRTRRFLRMHYGAIRLRDPLRDEEIELRFPRRRPPMAVGYDLAGTYGELFAGLEDWLGALRFPAIGAGHDNEDSGDSLVCPGELLKIILLKRLESSIEAFRCTIVQQLAWCNTALRAIDAGRVLTRPDYRASFRGPADDPGSQLAFFELMLPAPSIEPERITEFRRLLESDMAILSNIHTALLAVGPGCDLKLQKLIELLDGPLEDEKVLVFTEFRDTARYLHHELRRRSHIAEVDSQGARLGMDRASRREVIERFAPRSNNLREPPERERVDTLIATDVLSEGLNLQDASVVVSYDLPWNPVRLMQRIGRIDRLGAVHEVVELHHFVPAHDLDRLLGLMARLHGKVSTIQGALGLDQPVLATPGDADRAIECLRILARDPDGYDRVEEQMEGPLDPEEQAYIDCVALSKDTHADTGPGPAVAAITDPSAAAPRAVAYWRMNCGEHSRGLWMTCDLDTGGIAEDQAGAVAAFRRSLASTAPIAAVERKAVGRWVQSARRAFSRYARGVLARVEAARIAGDALSPNLPQCRIAAWLSRNFESAATRHSRDQRVMIDALLERLAQRFTLAAERSLAGLVAELPDRPTPEVLGALAEMLGSFESDGSGPARLQEVGMLLLLSQPSPGSP